MNPLFFCFVSSLSTVCSFVFVVKHCRVWLVFECMTTSKGHLLVANILVFQCFE